MTAAIPERRPTTEQISGVIERVTFHNVDSGFCVLRVKTRGHREETTVIGSLPSVTAGEWLVAEGCWVRDREHGLQFKATMMKTVPPTTAEGIERYLGSGLVKGIGPILATVLALAAASDTIARGILLLAVYSAGLAVPFLLTALGIGQFLRFYQNFRKYLHAVEVFSGALLIFVGGLVFVNKLTWLSGKLTFLNRFSL